MKVKAKNLKAGHKIELLNGNIAEVNHLFKKDDNAYILLDNHRWYVYFLDEIINLKD